MKKIKTSVLSVLTATAVLLLSIFVPLGTVQAATERTTNNMRIAVGSTHALIIDSEGNVWSLGGNDFRQLGDGTNETRWEPNLVYHNSTYGKAVSVAAGSTQSMLLTENGKVYTWGMGDAAMRLEAIDESVSAISAGQEFCMAILRDGSARVWSSKVPYKTVQNQKDETLYNIKEISVGSNEMILLRTSNEGTVYQLNTNDYKTAVPVLIDEPDPTPTSTPEPTPTLEPTSTPEPTTEPTEELSAGTVISFETDQVLRDAVAISAGKDFGAALLSTGEVYTWGQSRNGVLGLGSVSPGVYPDAQRVDALEFDPISKIDAGDEHTIVISDAGTLFGWGNASSGRLEIEKSGLMPTPVQLDLGLVSVTQFDCGKDFNVALDSAGKFYFWGNNKDIYELVFEQKLAKTDTPYFEINNVEDESMTVSWDPDEYYTSLMTGFMVIYSLPNGTEHKTPLLPVDLGQITLRGLQPETNYTVLLQAHSVAGFIEETFPLVVPTLKDDGVSPTPEPTPTNTPEPTASPTSQAESSQASSIPANGGDEDDLSNLFGILLIGLIIIVLIGAIIAIIYVWRRIDRTDDHGVKPVRISRTDEDYEDPDEDYMLLDDLPEEKEGMDWQDIGDTAEQKIITETDLEKYDPDEDVLLEEPEDLKKKKYDDDDDDFIVRRPDDD